MRLSITGIGAVSPAGTGLEALWQACCNGGACFAPIDHFPGAGRHLAGFARVADGEPGPADAGRMAHLFRAAVDAALAEAPLRPAGDRTVIVVGTTTTTRHQHRFRDGEAGPPVADELAGALGTGRLRASMLVVGNASASGAVALAVARDLMLTGTADRVVVAGVDVVTESAFAGLAALRALSEAGCRPFAADRSGIRIAECGAAIVIDRTDQPGGLALAGAAMSNLAHQMARPEHTAIATAVQAALRDAGLEPAQVGYVNAHAAGTQQGDDAELRALTEVFGAGLPAVPISSIKGAVGHSQGAAGVLETAVTAAALARGQCPPTYGLDKVDAQWDHLDLCRTPRPMPLPVAISVSCGLGGTNAAVVLTGEG